MLGKDCEDHAPARIHQNNFLSCCQVEADSSGLKTDKKHFTPRIILQVIERLGTFFTFHGSVQAIITDFVNQESVFDPVIITNEVKLALCMGKEGRQGAYLSSMLVHWELESKHRRISIRHSKG